MSRAAIRVAFTACHHHRQPPQLLFLRRRNASSAAVQPQTLGGGEGGKRASGKKERSLDPFGIEEILHEGQGDTSSSTIPSGKRLVEGFYDQEFSARSVENQSPDEEPPVHKKYDEWLKSRAETVMMNKTGAVSAESLRNASFGSMRIDSDNVVKEHGQYDDPKFHVTKETPEQKRNTRGSENEDSEDVKEYMQASQLLAKIRTDAGGRKETKSIIDTLQSPPSPSKKLVNKVTLETDKEVARVQQIFGPGGGTDKNNSVPKVYQIPSYNHLTRGDMWCILKQSVIFQNEHIIAINKPSGVPMHSTSVDCRHRIVDFNKEFAELAKCDEIFPLHRLDKETTGALIFAKNPRIATYVKEKFALRQVSKTYLCIVKNCPELREGTIKIPIGFGTVGGTDKYRSTLRPDLREFDIKTKQNQCRDAVTHFRVISSLKEAAFLEVRIETGIKHQIRVHLGLGLGCPVFGDHKYSHRDRLAPQRLHPQMLHRMGVRQTKVRDLPLHLHCNSISFTLPDGAVEGNEAVYAHAHVPNFFKNTLKCIGLKT